MALDPVNLDDLYREVILDHYREPCGRDPIEGATSHGEGWNPVCGDECRVELRVADSGIQAMQVTGRGCSISVASGSILAQLISGRSIEETRHFIAAFRAMMHGEPLPPDTDLGDLEVLAGIKNYPVRVKCAMLAWTTLESALAGGCGKATTEGTVDDVESA